MNAEPSNTEADDGKYRVVALRYRPTDFDDLIGQSQVSTALRNAIQQNRVGHAYLFTGARGVGKTSSARIFAKCLNCQTGPTIKPCGKCDICDSVSYGEDVDVLEIDGASNRGIDEIRQLRANANVRPSRGRYKIYIIDEVHMLTVAAFNALLKTLEEPPAHVKFIFCTTDPEKIPITVLSRCQRFDFPPIQTQSIVERLRHIVENEEIEADDKALELLARRAGGSMRDSQSLLEQLLSYTSDRITEAEVHALLGTADNDAVFNIADAIVAGDSAAALSYVHQFIEGGVDGGQLTAQLLGLFRDAMACLVGCGDELLLNCSSDDMPRLQALSGSLGVEKVLSILQVLDQTLVKVRHSTSVRTMLEMTVVRCCHLENLDLIPQLIKQLQSGDVAAPAARKPAAAKPAAAKPRTAKKKQSDVGPANVGVAMPRSETPSVSPSIAATSATESVASQTSAKPPEPPEPPEPNESNSEVEPVSEPNTEPVAKPITQPATNPIAGAVSGTTSSPPPSLQAHNLEETWRKILAEFNDLTAESASNFDSLELSGERLTVSLKSALDQEMCDRPAAKQRLEKALAAATGSSVRIDFKLSDKPESIAPRPQHISRRQRIRNLESNEFIKTALDLFDAEITDVQAPRKRK